jgi:ABC-2 type transport system ATP-binding protein
MSVIVSHLTKTYGTQNAVDNISFTAQKGEILGFLGPNGAGKTTTMKMITCFTPPTSGSVTVCGHAVGKATNQVKKHIGYLPEHNPLYLEMYVQEYLLFIAGLHKVKYKKEAVESMIERTGLSLERHKLIGSLSKGYRQRVGLAQAMLHDPEVLILDEPTSGLDPNQLIEIRRLIKELGSEKTVIFSSHIMQEVQALCDRVIILNKGAMVANNSIELLQQQLSKQTQILLEFNAPVDDQLLKKYTDISSLKCLGPNRYKILTNSKKDIRPDLFRFAVEQSVALLEMHQKNTSIEEVFQEVTK